MKRFMMSDIHGFYEAFETALNKVDFSGENQLFLLGDNESPYAEGGQERMRRWSKLGVKVMDSETSALYVIGTILKLKVASSAVIKENYMTNQMMTEQQRLKALKKLFIKSCEIFCCQG